MRDTDMAGPPPARTADSMAPAADDDSPLWLGCEGLHPLTWLPAPAAAAGTPDND